MRIPGKAAGMSVFVSFMSALSVIGKPAEVRFGPLVL